MTDSLLGEALGQPYVDATFGPDGKQRMLKMVNALEESLGQDIQGLDWMTPETKKQALVKLHAITNKIGYPDTWRDYSSVKIVRGDLVGDVQRARAFEIKRNLNKIGKPLDKKEWGMTPPTVNAYYSPSNNDINFPAGILQPPFFDKDADDAVNFGGIGVVIGHELTHGFDDQGSKFDAEGNLKNWWTQADRDEFDKRTSCIADEYSSFVAVDDVHLNGRLTLGENTADNGGLRIALAALHKDMEMNPKVAATKDGFTPEQRFFLGLCPGLVPECNAGKFTAAGQDRSAFARSVPHQWHAAKQSGLCQSVWLQGWPENGQRQCLPRLVRLNFFGIALPHLFLVRQFLCGSCSF